MVDIRPVGLPPNGNPGIVPPWLTNEEAPSWDDIPSIPELQQESCEERDLTQSGYIRVLTAAVLINVILLLGMAVDYILRGT